jgi:hypothetical protein
LPSHLSPRNNPQLLDSRQKTTYNYNFRDPYPIDHSFYQQQEPQNPQQQQLTSLNLSNSSNQFHLPQINSQATVLNLHPVNSAPPPPPPQPRPEPLQPQQTQLKYEMTTQLEKQAQARQMERPKLRKSDSELNRVSNRLYVGNDPSPDAPNDPFWFGRAGPSPSKLSILKE